MITIFSGTNRPLNNTLKIATLYAALLENEGIEQQVFSLEDLPSNIAFSEVFGERSVGFKQIIHKYVIPADRVVFLVPEYNGSYPGIVKLFLDAVEPSVWKGKKAAIVGIASGRAGNLRGADHLVTVLNYLKMEVYSFKPLLSSIELYLDENGELTNMEYMKNLKTQISGFLKF